MKLIVECNRNIIFMGGSEISVLLRDAKAAQALLPLFGWVSDALLSAD